MNFKNDVIGGIQAKKVFFFYRSEQKLKISFQMKQIMFLFFILERLTVLFQYQMSILIEQLDKKGKVMNKLL